MVPCSLSGVFQVSRKGLDPKSIQKVALYPLCEDKSFPVAVTLKSLACTLSEVVKKV